MLEHGAIALCDFEGKNDGFGGPKNIPYDWRRDLEWIWIYPMAGVVSVAPWGSFLGDDATYRHHFAQSPPDFAHPTIMTCVDSVNPSNNNSFSCQSRGNARVMAVIVPDGDQG